MHLHAHNFLNDVIAFQFDFTDEEIAENYMSWLKGLATRLTPDLVQYYFPRGTCPLLVQAQKFFAYPEAMTRTAARTVALCLFKTKHPDVVRIACDIGFFTHFICHIRKQWFDIDALISAGTSESSTKLQIAVDEQIDHLYYLNDLCDVGHTTLMNAVGDELLKQLLLPMVAGSLGVTGTNRGAVSIQWAEFMFVQVITVLKHRAVVNGLIAAVFLREISPDLLQLCLGDIPPAPSFPSYSSPVLLKPDIKDPHSPKSALRAVCRVLDWVQGLDPLPCTVPNPIRVETLTFLRSKDDNLIVLTCLTLSALLVTPDLQRSVLVAAGLLPKAQVKAQALYSAVLAEFQGPEKAPRPVDAEIPKLMLSIVACEPPFRLTTVTLVCQLILALENGLSEEHFASLDRTLLVALQKVNFLRSKSFYVDCFVDLFEEAREEVIKLDLTAKIPCDIHYLVPLSEPETAKLPLNDRDPNGEIETARRDIHFLLLLLKLRALLRGEMDTLAAFAPQTEYSEGRSYALQDFESTQCVLKQAHTSLPCLLLSNPTFFLLASPTPPNHLTLSTAVSLRKVEAMVDRADPRTLVLALKQGSSGQAELQFASVQVCGQVKKDIDACRKEAQAAELGRTEALLQALDRTIGGDSKD